MPYAAVHGLVFIVAFNTYQEGEVSALTRVLDISAPAGMAAVTTGAAIGTSYSRRFMTPSLPGGYAAGRIDEVQVSGKVEEA